MAEVPLVSDANISNSNPSFSSMIFNDSAPVSSPDPIQDKIILIKIYIF